MSHFELLITSQQELVYAGQIDYVIMSSEGGEIGVFPKHTPLLTKLKPGPTRFKSREEADEQVIYTSGGIVEVLPHKVSMLIDLVARSDDLDAQAIEQMRAQAEEELAKYPQGSATYQETLANLNVALAQLQVLKLIKKK